MNGLTIGEAAEQAKVHIETLRYYEQRGLIASPPRSTSNYRLYPEDAVRRVPRWAGAVLILCYAVFVVGAWLV